MIVETRAGWTDTRTGEIVRPPRTHWDTRKMRRQHKRELALRDLTVALAIYSFGATCVIAGLLA